jgi:hypothetical protein
VVFPHVVCDTPLGEAVDAGIIKTPVIGKSGQIIEQPHDDDAYRFARRICASAMNAGGAVAMSGRRAATSRCYSSCAKTLTQLTRSPRG